MQTSPTTESAALAAGLKAGGAARKARTLHRYQWHATHAAAEGGFSVADHTRFWLGWCEAAGWDPTGAALKWADGTMAVGADVPKLAAVQASMGDVAPVSYRARKRMGGLKGVRADTVVHKGRFVRVPAVLQAGLAKAARRRKLTASAVIRASLREASPLSAEAIDAAPHDDMVASVRVHLPIEEHDALQAKVEASGADFARYVRAAIHRHIANGAST